MKLLLYPDKRIAKTRLEWGLSFIDGVKIGSVEDFDVGFHWNYNDIKTPSEQLAEIINTGRPIHNLRLRNVTKKAVDEHFTKAFGYSSLVPDDGPRGVYVVKMNKQSRGNAYISEDPVSNTGLSDYNPKYRINQKYINTEKNGVCEEHRMFVFCDRHFVVRKRKPLRQRFKSGAKEYALFETEDVFSSSEIKNIAKFNKSIGLDFGEVDILRDKDGLIYIVDVNDIPGGGPPIRDIVEIRDRYVQELRIMLGLTGKNPVNMD